MNFPRYSCLYSRFHGCTSFRTEDYTVILDFADEPFKNWSLLHLYRFDRLTTDAKHTFAEALKVFFKTEAPLTLAWEHDSWTVCAVLGNSKIIMPSLEDVATFQLYATPYFDTVKETVSEASENDLLKFGLKTGVIAGVALVTAPVVLTAAGFGAGGIAAGSIAATIQGTWFGGTVAGTSGAVFGALQGMGAAGLGVAAKTAIVAATGAGVKVYDTFNGGKSNDETEPEAEGYTEAKSESCSRTCEDCRKTSAQICSSTSEDCKEMRAQSCTGCTDRTV
ncbi:uncharacterized protein TNCV_1923061 [Trichonephila clavipes]|nr:uncharacterized protein TNCV_1923061 [Trichonephila clavipes]